MAKIEGFITNLGKYNEGELIGKWIEFPISDDELQNVLKEIGCYYVDDDGVEHNVEYEEYFFTDWNNDIAFDFGEYPDLEEVNEFAERVEALSESEQEYIELLMGGYTSNINEALDIIEGGNYVIWHDCYCMADVAERMAAEFGDLNDVPEHLQYYIDYEKWGRDLDIEGTYLAGDDYYLKVLN